jgi:hypothetical protein
MVMRAIHEGSGALEHFPVGKCSSMDPLGAQPDPVLVSPSCLGVMNLDIAAVWIKAENSAVGHGLSG